MQAHWLKTFGRSEDGANLIELALLLPVLLLLLIGAIDFGRAYYIAIEMNSAAHAAALYGAQNPDDTTGITAAATSNLTDLTSQTHTIEVDNTNCECFDGTSIACGAPNTCTDTGNVLQVISVTVTSTYTPILPYPGIPNPIALTAHAQMRAAQ